MIKITPEQYAEKRAEYLKAGNGSDDWRALQSAAHHEFYTWLSTAIGVTPSDVPVKLEKLLASSDPHMNDIPLNLWDRQDYVVRQKAIRAGMRSWSTSNTVCCLKTYARNMVNAHNAAK